MTIHPWDRQSQLPRAHLPSPKLSTSCSTLLQGHLPHLSRVSAAPVHHCPVLISYWSVETYFFSVWVCQQLSLTGPSSLARIDVRVTKSSSNGYAEAAKAHGDWRDWVFLCFASRKPLFRQPRSPWEKRKCQLNRAWHHSTGSTEGATPIDPAAWHDGLFWSSTFSQASQPFCMGKHKCIYFYLASGMKKPKNTLNVYLRTFPLVYTSFYEGKVFGGFFFHQRFK